MRYKRLLRPRRKAQSVHMSTHARTHGCAVTLRSVVAVGVVVICTSAVPWQSTRIEHDARARCALTQSWRPLAECPAGHRDSICQQQQPHLVAGIHAVSASVDSLSAVRQSVIRSSETAAIWLPSRLCAVKCLRPQMQRYGWQRRRRLLRLGRKRMVDLMKTDVLRTPRPYRGSM